MILTKEQKEAIEYVKGPLLIIAGPGSGKTEVLSRKVAYLLNQGFNEEDLLITTFSNRATDELKTRIKKHTKKEVEKIQISTIHSFCNTLINDHIEKSEYNLGYKILEDIKQYFFVLSNLEELGLKDMVLGNKDKLNSILSIFNKCTEELIQPEEYINYAQKKLKEIKESTKGKDISHFFENNLSYIGNDLDISLAFKKYQELLKKNNMIDYSGLLAEANRLIQYDDVKLKLQNKYKYVLVDEYQDTNYIQEVIISSIVEKHKRICVVGDDDQSIYRFRGATVDNMLNFQNKYKSTKIIHLNKNFRSTKTIVEATSKLITNNKFHLKKKLMTNNETGKKIIVLKSEDDNHLANQTSKLIKLLLKKNIISSFSDIAVLCRSVKVMLEILLYQ